MFGGFHILIDRESYYGFNNLTNKTEEVGRNLSVSKTDKDCLQVSFPSTSSVQFCEKKEMMSFVVTLGDNFKNATKGLLGTWNDDTEDDFTLPDGTVLSSSLSLREIHFGFGVKWQINQSQSLFTYADNESVASFSDLDFEPMFADNITWQNDSIKIKAKAQCGDDHECLFDVASTNDLSVGLVTKDISVQLVNESKQLNNFPPKIVNTSDEINATLHKIIELNITAEDDSAITFRVINKPVGATWNQTGNVLLFYWKVTSSQKFNLTFVATDDQGASAIWSPTIRMCACQHDGQCVEPEEGDAENTDSKFVYLGCVCQGGYTGRFCDSDIDACELNGEPCYAGVECTDLPAPANSSGYKCGPCPSGYTGDGAQCADIDECKSDSPKQCEHKCINTPASFFCDCNDGFKLKSDRRNCEDIDECDPTSNCMQKCENSVGSYNCSCNTHFKTDPTDWRKCVAKNPCTSDSDPGCNHVCYEDSNKQAACTCRANFELQSDGKTCKDINECLDDDTYECPDKNQRCVNTRGSYRCECVQDTYYFDGKCQGLKKNQPRPKLLLPEPRNASESEKEEAVQFSIPSGFLVGVDKDHADYDSKTEIFKFQTANRPLLEQNSHK
ncbi:mucin-like protein [Stylophora pistillata]|uniref:mucin-like protein n=1 Tax=Stylophora pistillata TaxID=50429 RepID=UPI000C0501D2|nr:mucin-like protein [Stylophora pistillata]